MIVDAANFFALVIALNPDSVAKKDLAMPSAANKPGPRPAPIPSPISRIMAVDEFSGFLIEAATAPPSLPEPLIGR